MPHKLRGRAAGVWAGRLLRGLVRDHGAAPGQPAVVRCMGRLVLLEEQPARPEGTGRPMDRADLLLEWTRSGDLTLDQAELLIALDETTLWAV